MYTMEVIQGKQWIDGQIKPNVTYGTDVNQSLLKSINEFALDQLFTEPTCGRTILDLIFSSHPESISHSWHL